VTVTELLAAKLAIAEAGQSDGEYKNVRAFLDDARTTTPALIRALMRIAEVLQAHRGYCEEHGVNDCDMAIIDHEILADLARELEGK